MTGPEFALAATAGSGYPCRVFRKVTFIGFGEAGMAFAEGMPASITAYDRKTYIGATRRAKLDDYRELQVSAAMTNQAAVMRADLIVSLVTADRALAAARETARTIAPNALYLDMNSVAPGTKRCSAEAISAAGGRYVDVAVMAPVHPGRRAVPLLVAGPFSDDAASELRALGFSNVTVAGDATGEASAVKMFRSVMVKGIEALTAECLLAAEAAGVREAVIASLDASWPGADWMRRGDYNLGRMIVHGIRRADEMDEVVATLDMLGTGSAMARATADWQRAVGTRRLIPPEGLEAKLAVLLGRAALEEAA